MANSVAGSAGASWSIAWGAAAAARPRLDGLRIAIACLVWCYVWRLQDLISVLGVLQAALLSALAATLLFLASPKEVKRLTRLRDPVARLTLVILALMILSVPTSLWPSLSFSFIVGDHLKTLLMTVLILASVRGFVDVERLAAVQVVGGTILCASVLSEFKTDSNGRLVNLPYYDANDLSMLLVATLPVALYFLRRGSPRLMRLVALPAAALFLLTFIKAGSRGGFLGLIAVAVFMLATFTATPARYRIAWLVAGALSLSLAGSDQYWRLMRTILNPKEDYNWAGNAETGRSELWKRGMGYMWQRPLLGVGVRAFSVAEGTISPLAGRAEYGRGVRMAVAHNSFVQSGAELGVPGLISFITLLVMAFRSLRIPVRSQAALGAAARSEAAMAQALRASLVGFAVAGFFISQAYSAFLYSQIGIIVGFIQVRRGSDGGELAAAIPGL